jgi:hypothetical protein
MHFDFFVKGLRLRYILILRDCCIFWNVAFPLFAPDVLPAIILSSLETKIGITMAPPSFGSSFYSLQVCPRRFIGLVASFGLNLLLE